MAKPLYYILLVSILMSCHHIPNKVFDNDTVDLSSKRLTSFPKEILYNKGLKHLNLGVKSLMIYSLHPNAVIVDSANRIKKLPGNIDVLQNLQSLDLSFNKLEGLPESFYNLKQLELLNLNYNTNITVAQVEKLKALPNLRKLYIIGIIKNSKDSTHIREAFSNTGINVYFNWSDLNESTSDM